MPTYRAFGLTLASDRPVPGLVPTSASERVDTHVWFAASPDEPVGTLPEELWFQARELADGEPALRAWRLDGGRYFRLRYADGTEFVVEGAGQHVWARWSPTSTLEDTATYLLGPVLGLVLRLRGVACLHASAVAVGTHAVAFVGSAYAGKSTIAATFVRMGHRALADDIVALTIRNGVAYAVPAYAQLRLWPESVALLYGAADALPPLTPTWDKRGLDLSRGAFQEEPLPLAAIYVLDPRSSDASPRIELLSGRECLLTLLGNSYVSYLMDRTQRREEFELLSRLVNEVPMCRLGVPHAVRHAAQLRDVIVEDCEARRCTALPITGR
jgi:hypothetical protein